MRRAPVLLLAAGMAILPTAQAFPGDRQGKDAAPGDPTTPEGRLALQHQEAIDRGLEWLARQQDARGTFPTSPPGGANGPNYQTAVTALATLAFLGAGH